MWLRKFCGGEYWNDWDDCDDIEAMMMIEWIEKIERRGGMERRDHTIIVVVVVGIQSC